MKYIHTHTLRNSNSGISYLQQQTFFFLFTANEVMYSVIMVKFIDSKFYFFLFTESANALIVDCGYQSTHVIPFINGRLMAENCRRINVGGLHLDSFLHRLLQLKYPSHFAAITLSRAEVSIYIFFFTLSTVNWFLHSHILD